MEIGTRLHQPNFSLELQHHLDQIKEKKKDCCTARNITLFSHSMPLLLPLPLPLPLLLLLFFLPPSSSSILLPPSSSSVPQPSLSLLPLFLSLQITDTYRCTNTWYTGTDQHIPVRWIIETGLVPEMVILGKNYRKLKYFSP